MIKKTTSENPRRQQAYIRGIKKGLAPGTTVFVGQRKLEKARIDLICYSPDEFYEIQDAGLEDIDRLQKTKNIIWVNVNGVHDVSLIEAVGNTFGLHPLTLEDIANTTQRPKAEQFDDYIFLVLKMITYVGPKGEIRIENVSLILGPGFVISFQEDPGDVFNTVRERIKAAKGRMRKLKADYLMYALMDAIIDEYFVSLENIGEYIEDLDDEITSAPEQDHLREIHRLKHNILFLRKSVWPLREVVSLLEKTEMKMIEKSTRLFIRDLYDHTVQVIDMVETYRDILGGMHDTYLSSVNNRLNDIMRTLTVIATIFIPLTFIAGVYGMNFRYMPELEWQGGYFATLGFMGLVAVGMLAYFWRKGWFRS